MRVFKEGQIKWAELGAVKPAFLTRSKLDWISRYTASRINKLTTHLKRSPKDQEHIAYICSLNDSVCSGKKGNIQGQSQDQQMAKPPQGVSS